MLLGAGSVGVVVGQLAFRSMLIAVLVPADYGRLSLVRSFYNIIWIIGAGGLPSGVARYIAVITPADDSAVVRAAVRAGVLPTVVAATLMAVVSGVILNSSMAGLFAAVGLSSLVYALLTMGVLRGRGRIGSAAAILPIGGLSEVALLAILLLYGSDVTPLSGFGVFCAGNVIGLGVGIFYMMRTAPDRASGNGHPAETVLGSVPTSRQLFGFSMWLGIAMLGITMLPLVVRLAAALDSYTVVAIIDVALILLSVPQRLGSILVAAVVPHASRALNKDNENLTISRREHFVVIAPFVLAAIVVAFTPVVGWLFDALGRPEYAKSAEYLALALLAGPACVLYGLVEGVLAAQGEGKFLAFNSLSITAVASVTILVTAALGSMVAAFAAFAVACWAVYLCGLERVRRLSSARGQPF
jgi:O-antigen/teichoic acid export membrane protein